MGYRHYFYKVKIEDVEKIKDISVNELKRRFADKDGYICFDDVINQKCVFEFGKLYYEDTVEQINNTGVQLFTNEETWEYMTTDNDYYVVGKKGLLKAIEIKKNKIIEYYEDLFVDTTNKYTNEIYTSSMKLKDSADEDLRWWKSNLVVNLNEDNKYEITGSWLHEHQIFNLVYLLKTIDWEKETILFYGW